MEAPEPPPPPDQPENPVGRGWGSPAGLGRFWPWMLIGLLILAYAGIWVWLAAPYRPFPGDDGRLWGHMIQGSWLHVRDGFEPVAEISLRAFRWVATLFVARSPALLVGCMCACYVGIFGTMAWLGWR